MTSEAKLQIHDHVLVLRLASHHDFRPPPAGSRLDREILTHLSESWAVKTPKETADA